MRFIPINMKVKNSTIETKILQIGTKHDELTRIIDFSALVVFEISGQGINLECSSGNLQSTPSRKFYNPTSLSTKTRHI